MVIQPQDTVYYVWQNQIYKGEVLTENYFDGLFTFWQVKTHHGLQVFADYELYESVDRLIDSIMHESCWS